MQDSRDINNIASDLINHNIRRGLHHQLPGSRLFAWAPALREGPERKNRVVE